MKVLYSCLAATLLLQSSWQVAWSKDADTSSKAESTISSSRSLPNPLSLDQALQFADESHPDLLIAKARVDEAQAQLLRAEAQTNIHSFLDLSAQRLKLTTTGEFVNDNYARLVINKTLYDFGHSSALEDSRTADINSRQYQFVDAKLQHQLEIIKRFFDVLLADFRYSVDNEEMVQRYLKFDKIRERHELGMISPIELNKAENYYREAYDIRDASEKNQHTTRLLLSLALNHPEHLPADLVEPEAINFPDQVPEPEQIYEQAMRANPTILSLQQDVEAARNRVVAERARYRPVLSAEVQVADYERPLNSRGDYLAALTLRVPIYQGNDTQAEIARATADYSVKIAQLQKAQQLLLQTISNLIKDLEILRTKGKTSQQRLAYRELDLEYKRGLYELEIQTTFGEAQARMTEAQWLAEKIKYDTAFTWAQLNILMGKPPLENKEVTSP